MRIVAGTARGRRIAVPAGRGTRPTSDRAREAMFSTLATLLDLQGARVLDLYAGSGAVGLEALSRGAGHATLVESDHHAAQLITANAETLGLHGAQVLAEPVERFLRSPPAAAPYSFVFADPPYDMDSAVLSVQLGTLADRVGPGGIVVVERSARDPEWSWPPPLQAGRARRYGAGMLWYGRRP